MCQGSDTCQRKHDCKRGAVPFRAALCAPRMRASANKAYETFVDKSQWYKIVCYCGAKTNKISERPPQQRVFLMLSRPRAYNLVSNEPTCVITFKSRLSLTHVTLDLGRKISEDAVVPVTHGFRPVKGLAKAEHRLRKESLYLSPSTSNLTTLNLAGSSAQTAVCNPLRSICHDGPVGLREAASSWGSYEVLRA
jgi:hypothetical protein